MSFSFGKDCTETGFGLIYSFIKNKGYFELWGLDTPYQVAELAYKIIKDNQCEYDEITGFYVYRFKYLNEIEYLGVKLDNKGLIEELRPYEIDSGEALFLNAGYLNIKEIN